MEHAFTIQIKTILKEKFGALYEAIYEKSSLLQYLNIKTVSATRGSKARAVLATSMPYMFSLRTMLKGIFTNRVITLIMPAHSFLCSLSDSGHFHLVVSYKIMRSTTG